MQPAAALCFAAFSTRHAALLRDFSFSFVVVLPCAQLLTTAYNAHTVKYSKMHCIFVCIYCYISITTTPTIDTHTYTQYKKSTFVFIVSVVISFFYRFYLKLNYVYAFLCGLLNFKYKLKSHQY